MDSKTYTAMARRLQAERRELIAALQQANGLLSDICDETGDWHIEDVAAAHAEISTLLRKVAL